MNLNDIFSTIRESNSSNCSIYFLTSGFFTYESLSSGLWSRNNTDDPHSLFYLTNCSRSELSNASDLLRGSLVNDGNQMYPYSESNSADDFIATLFTLSGVCAASWMLSMMQFLSPKHKRKSWMALLATLMFSIMTTIVLNRYTRTSANQYHKDVVDIVRIHKTVYNDRVYEITYTVSQFLVNLAWLEMVIRLSKKKLKWIVGIAGSILIISYMVVMFIFQLRFNLLFTGTLNDPWSSYHTWRFARILLRLILISGFWASVLHYTILQKNTTKVSYSKRLLPLATVVQITFVMIVVINILIITYFRYNWQRVMWLRFLPSLFEVILITLVWEWIRNIELLEKRQELTDVLGRRISIDDVLNLHSDDSSHNVKPLSQRKNYSIGNLSRWLQTKSATGLKRPENASTSNKEVSMETVVAGNSGWRDRADNTSSVSASSPSPESRLSDGSRNYIEHNSGEESHHYPNMDQEGESPDSIHINDYDFGQTSTSSSESLS